MLRLKHSILIHLQQDGKYFEVSGEGIIYCEPSVELRLFLSTLLDFIFLYVRLMKTNKTLLISLHAGIIALYVGMFAVMLAQVPPHPAGEMGPIIVAILSMGIVSLISLIYESPFHNIFISIFLILSLIGLGPHKYFLDPNGKEVVPILLFGNIYLGLYIFYFLQERLRKK